MSLNRLKYQSGITLLEFSVGSLLFFLLISVALTNYDELSINYQREITTRQFEADLRRIRAESAARGQIVILSTTNEAVYAGTTLLTHSYGARVGSDIIFVRKLFERVNLVLNQPVMAEPHGYIYRFPNAADMTDDWYGDFETDGVSWPMVTISGSGVSESYDITVSGILDKIQQVGSASSTSSGANSTSTSSTSTSSTSTSSSSGDDEKG